MKALISICSIVTLAGCSGDLGHVLSTYESVSGVDIQTSAGEFRIWDRPDLGKILTSPALSDIVSQRHAAGLDLDPMGDNAAAARQWLSSSGRRCTITESHPVINPEVEHSYKCV